jgi:hypothetical protein
VKSGQPKLSANSFVDTAKHFIIERKKGRAKNEKIPFYFPDILPFLVYGLYFVYSPPDFPVF